MIEKISNNKGQSLFEVTVALGVVGLVLLALVAVATVSIRNSTFSKNVTLATRYSQEAIEWLRSEKSSNWLALVSHISSSSRYCLDRLNWDHPVSSDCGSRVISGTFFKRLVYFSNLADSNGDGQDDTVTAEVTTYWTDARGYHDARSATIFTSWN
jgi:type II secretory pathway pseudopilin PulG